MVYEQIVSTLIPPAENTIPINIFACYATPITKYGSTLYRVPSIIDVWGMIGKVSSSSSDSTPKTQN